MAHTTSRLGIDVVDGGDNVSAYPAANAQAMGVLDNAAVYNEGTLVGRPGAGTVAHGTIYYATDTGVYYLSNGTAWSTMLVGGAWSAVTLGTNVVAGTGYTPAARIAGDMVSLRGAPQTTGVISGGATLFTVPGGMKPASQVVLSTVEGRGSSTTLPYPISIDPSTGHAAGVYVGDSSFGSGNVLSLDGFSYSLS